MKPKYFFCWQVRFLLLAILSTLAFDGRAISITWTNVAGGNWSVAGNWNPNQVPGAADVAQISTAGTYTVTNNQNTTVNTVNVGNGSSGSQKLQIAGGTALTFTSSSLINGTASLTVLSGGFLNMGTSAALSLEGPATNNGTINVTNGAIYLYNNGTASEQGGFVNQAGGQINLNGSAGMAIQTGPNDYFINQGTLNKITGSGTSAVYSSAGVLMGTYNAASGTIIQFGGGIASAPLQADPSLVMNGPGQYQFNSGFLNFPTNVISNLTLITGTLTLGTGFQGGAITNLTLNGITLTNNNALPVTGTLTVTNGFVLGALTVSSGGGVQSERHDP